MVGVKLSHPPNLASVLSVKKGGQAYVFHAIFIALYAYSLYWCYSTAGEPLAEALLARGHTTEEGKVKAAPAAVAAFKAFDSIDDGDGNEDDAEELDEPVTADQLAAAPEEDDPMKEEDPLPSQFLPSFWAVVFFAATVFLHALFVMMGYWMVGFRATVYYNTAPRVKEGGYVLVYPHRHQGFADIVKVERSKFTQKLFFIFQRQKYEICDEGGKRLYDETTADEAQPVQCPSELPLKNYVSNKVGLRSSSLVEAADDQYGKNVFSLPKPKFLELYKEQLMSPIACFQFFCAILWLLDEYWKYTMFTMVMILVFEGTTTMTRLKNLDVLRGMSNKPYDVYVYREDRWKTVLSTDLLPGDLCSIKRHQSDGSGGTIVPCDCIILSGTAVVNESTLTGESVPQLKEALRVSEGSIDLDRPLEMEGRDKNHVLYSGTLLMQDAPGKDLGACQSIAGVPAAPDSGCVCFVLRTGFSSSQGKLMRMIEFSTQQVRGNVKETIALLVMLLMFALTASGYVLKKGLEEGKRSKYAILLRCVQIITSVVPADLPMQAGLAVNTALMTLMKSNIFCTEPYRVPLAGKVTHCFFDKTGTLTTDQLEAVGVVSSHGAKPLEKGGQSDARSDKSNAKNQQCFDMLEQASEEVRMVIGGCHALMDVDGNLVGDPVDLASLKAIKWSYDHSKNLATNVPPKPKPKANSKDKDDKSIEATPSTDSPPAKPTVSITIGHRNRFASVLQRSSTIVTIDNNSNPSMAPSRMSSGVYCLVKGSPEAISNLLGKTETHRPAWYQARYQAMAERGMRVIAFAFKRIDASDVDLNAGASLQEVMARAAKKPREWAESDLVFAGFVAFMCRVRKDSEAVVLSLLQSKHRVIMATGDAPLTGLYVAAQVSIACCHGKKALLLQDGGKDGAALEWVGAGHEDLRAKVDPIPFRASNLPELSKKYDLVVTGKLFNKAVEMDPETWAHCDSIVVYARMSPEGKSQVIKALKDRKNYVLMCGDGGNDVGALKQAHVGLALLSGFGNANAVENKDLEKEKSPDAGANKDADENLNKINKENDEKMKKALAEARKKMNEDIKRKREELMSRQKEYVEEEMRRLEAEGQSGFMAGMIATKNVMMRIKNEVQAEHAKKNKEIMEKHGGTVASSAAQMTQLLGDAEEGAGLPMVKLGDASIAAPFTSKMPSIRSVADIIRQGRCTLVSTVQQQQILVLNCIITAYSLSALSLEGSRNSEAQMIATGTMLMIASMAFTFALPLDKLSPVRPLATVFHPATFVSIMGQLVIHVGCMYFVVSSAKAIMGEDELNEVIRFNRQTNKEFEASGDMETSMPHKPNLLNTAVFLVETAQQVSVLAVNYKGRPWTKSVAENSALLWSLFATLSGLVICSWELVPELNNYLGLVAMPSDEFRFQIFYLLSLSVVGAFVWDRVCLCVFAWGHFRASFSEAQLDPKAIWRGSKLMAGIVVGASVMLYFNLDLLTLGIIYWVYKKYKARKEEAAATATPPAVAPTPAR